MGKKLSRLTEKAIYFVSKRFEKIHFHPDEKKFGVMCFSQTGEDGILNSICPPQGFYIDVGAHHPIRYSNTHLLYRRGWRGINVDPTPGSMAVFEKFRPDDTNLEIAVGQKKGKKKFYVFEEGAFNTFDADAARKLLRKKVTRLTVTKAVPVLPLREICSRHVPSGTSIGLLTVDAEGHDLQILKSHDWVNWRPAIVVVEYHGKNSSWRNPMPFLSEKSYMMSAKTPFSLIFKDKSAM